MKVSQESKESNAKRGTAKVLLLDAAIDVIRAKGLHATTVEGLCAAAGVTKGAFFHHFETKEALAVAAADHWSLTTGALFAAADYHEPADAGERVLAYLDLRASLIHGGAAEYTCLAGTMTQEVFETSHRVRDACAASIFGHARTLEADISEALRVAENDEIDPASLARHTQAVLQGAFILAKASNDPAPVLESIAHLRRYLSILFDHRSLEEA